MSEAAVTRVDYHHAHHFESDDQEFISCKVGMWLFLLQEVLFFSPLFVGYAIFRSWYPEAFMEASALLDWKLGCLNTVVLISSSFSMALAVNAAQTGYQKKQVIYLSITTLFACAFLVVKYFEYTHKFHMGIGTAGLFSFEGITNTHVKTFFSLYFMMTGLHGIHVVLGIMAILWLLVRAKNKEFGPNYYTPVEMVGLYWHFVDLVWIYLFPMMYLIT